MAATNYTPIYLYNSGTATNVPVNSNLGNGELAINYTDGKLFYKDNTGTVQVIATKATSALSIPVSATQGGTGVANNVASTITISGSFGTTLTVTGTTAVTLPTSGTLLSTASVVTISQGGTNATATPTAGAVPYGTGTAYAFTAAGTTGQALLSNGSSAPTWGTVAVLATAQTFTATQTFNGTSSTEAMKILNIAEPANVVGSAPSSTTNFYVNSGAVQLYTTNAANNWTVNFAFSSGTSLNTAMSVGDSISCTLLATQGTTAYYNSAVTIDGTSVTPKWQGGTAPTKGNVSGIDSYTYVIVKTASATYTVLATQTQFA